MEKIRLIKIIVEYTAENNSQELYIPEKCINAIKKVSANEFHISLTIECMTALNTSFGITAIKKVTAKDLIYITP